ncbi:MAG: translational GTPase TypA, partial [Bacilli bacterium]
KAMSNQRSSNKDNTVVLKRARKAPLEVCLEYINEDELVEVTPRNIRLRKKILHTDSRKKSDSRKGKNH